MLKAHLYYYIYFFLLMNNIPLCGLITTLFAYFSTYTCFHIAVIINNIINNADKHSHIVVKILSKSFQKSRKQNFLKLLSQL